MCVCNIGFICFIEPLDDKTMTKGAISVATVIITVVVVVCLLRFVVVDNKVTTTKVCKQWGKTSFCFGFSADVDMNFRWRMYVVHMCEWARYIVIHRLLFYSLPTCFLCVSRGMPDLPSNTFVCVVIAAMVVCNQLASISITSAGRYVICIITICISLQKSLIFVGRKYLKLIHIFRTFHSKYNI